MATPIIIGISGPSGSGKSLLASTIAEELGPDKVTVISEDAYYKDLGDTPLEEKNKLNYDHPQAFDHDLLARHLGHLRQGLSIEMPQYDFATHARLSHSKTIAVNKIIVLEGILLFSDETLRSLMDIRIFVDTPLDICFIRRMTRDIEERQRALASITAQYLETVRPMYWQFIEPSKRYADIIVPRGGKNRVAIDVITAKMNELIEGNT